MIQSSLQIDSNTNEVNIDKWSRNLRNESLNMNTYQNNEDFTFGALSASSTSSPTPLGHIITSINNNNNNNHEDTNNKSPVHLIMYNNALTNTSANNKQTKHKSSFESDENASINQSSMIDNNNNLNPNKFNSLNESSSSSNTKSSKKNNSKKKSNSLNSRNSNQINNTNNNYESINNNGDPKLMNNNKKKYIIEYPIKLINSESSDQSNVFISFFKLIILFLINFTLFLPLIFLLTFVLMPLKYTSRVLFKLFHFCHLTDSSHLSPTEIPHFLNPTELFWLLNSDLNKETNSLTGNKSIGACLFFIEGYLAKNTIRDLIQNRIIQANLRSTLGEFNRFTERILNVLGFGYVWVKTNQFNLDDHIIEVDNSNNNFRTDKDLQKYLSNLIKTKTFSLDKPLWNLYYIKSYGQNLSDKTTVLIFLYHQSFASGVSLIRLFLKGLVDNRNAIDLKPRFGYFNFNLSLIKQILFGWVRIVYYLFMKAKDKNPLHNKYFKSDRFKNLNLRKASCQASSENLNNSTTPESKHILTWSEPFSLVLINRLKLVTRSKMNDLLISVLAGVLRNYLQLKGINHPADMQMIMPVDLSSNKFPFKLKNRSTLVSLRMPVNTEGSIPRLWSTKYQSALMKQSNNYLFFYFLINVLFNLLPNRVAFNLIKNVFDKNTFIASTLGAGDSSLSTLSLCNRNVRNLIYFNPGICNVTLSFSIVTYGDEIRLSMQADPNIITNPELITSEFIRQLEVLNDLLANRRIPGEIRRVVRPQIEIAPTGSGANMVFPPGEVAIEDMQQKMTDIQQELQILSEHLESLNPNSNDYFKQKQIILIKSEKLRKEFRNILMKLQVRQNLNSQAIPSDDEDDLDPNERIRLRSSSIASRMSLSSNSTSKRNRDSSSEHSNINMEKHESSRKESHCERNSRQNSLSFSSGISNEIITPVPNGLTSTHNLNNYSIENEIGFSNKQQTNTSHGSHSKTNFHVMTPYISTANENYLMASSYQNQLKSQNIQSNLINEYFEDELYNAQLGTD